MNRVYNSNGVCLFGGYYDWDGNPVEKTPITNPYNYDAYVVNKWDYKEGDSNTYSDRYNMWDAQEERKEEDTFHYLKRKHMKKHGDYFRKAPKETIELILSKWHGREVELTALVEYCNPSSGYPLWQFHFRDKEI